MGSHGGSRDLVEARTVKMARARWGRVFFLRIREGATEGLELDASLGGRRWLQAAAWFGTMGPTDGGVGLSVRGPYSNRAHLSLLGCPK